MINDMKNLRLITIMILLLSLTVGASAQSAKEYEQKKARLEREIAIIDKQAIQSANVVLPAAAFPDITTSPKELMEDWIITLEMENRELCTPAGRPMRSILAS